MKINDKKRDDSRVRAKKHLGQHFLKDQSVIHKITHDFVAPSDVIIEVGPGPAILSRNLANHKKPFYVIEKDDRFPAYLLQLLQQDHNVLDGPQKNPTDARHCASEGIQPPARTHEVPNPPPQVAVYGF